MQKNSKFFVDITEIAGWKGKLTGVPRVIYELSSRFSDDNIVNFVTWDSKQHIYVNASFSAIESQIFQSPQSTDSISPTAYKKFKNSIAKVESLRRIAVGSKKHVTKLLSKKAVVDPVAIHRGDTLLILSDWHANHSNFIPSILSLHDGGVKIVTICYDLLPIVTPQFSGHATKGLTRFSKKVYPICQVVFAISMHTKFDIENWLTSNKLPVPRIEVIRLGDDFKSSLTSSTQQEKVKSGDFILCVGTIEARKNHGLLYYTYKLAIQRGVDLPKIVIAGRRGWMTDDLYQTITTDPDVKDKFIFMHGVNDNELAWLYQNSLFSIYPSFYEGWGLPIAESIAYGTPVIASNTSSMPEIAGDLIDYFSPTSTDECLEAMVKMLDPTYLKKAKARIKKYQPHSWDETYSQVKEAL